jgi:hypothetical protein
MTTSQVASPEINELVAVIFTWVRVHAEAPPPPELMVTAGVANTTLGAEIVATPPADKVAFPDAVMLAVAVVTFTEVEAFTVTTGDVTVVEVLAFTVTTGDVTVVEVLAFTVTTGDVTVVEVLALTAVTGELTVVETEALTVATSVLTVTDVAVCSIVQFPPTVWRILSGKTSMLADPAGDSTSIRQ